MTQNTNLNISPYFDDFDDTKNYNKVLFKPGFPVQARELTTLQTIIQNQISKFGQYFFKEGSVVIPGGVSIDKNYTSVKIDPMWLNVPVKSYTQVLVDGNIKIKGETSGVTAVVINKLTETESIHDTDTIYIKYIGAGTDGKSKMFQDGENLITLGDINYLNTKIEANSTFAKCVDNRAWQRGSSVSINEGLYFIRGYFIKVPKETLILDQYNVKPSYKVGFAVSEEIVSADSANQDLYDNAHGFSNEAAPGADRFALSVKLAKKLLTDEDDKNFIELVRTDEGTVQKFINGEDPQFNIFAEALAKRTYDESGDYYVKPFTIDVRESLNDRISNRGLYFENKLTQSGNTPSDDLFCLNISPGRAYVKGYRVDKNRTTPVDVIKPRTTRSMDNISLPIDVGNIVRVNNISGSPSIGYGNTFSSVNLLDRRLGAGKLPHASAKVIGAARVYDWTPNTTGITTTFEARLFDIQTFTELTLGLTATINSGDYVEGKYSGGSGFVKLGAGVSSPQTTVTITLQDTKGSFRTNEPILINGKDAGRNITSLIEYDFDSIKSIHRNSQGLGWKTTVGVGTFAADLDLTNDKQVFDSGFEFNITSSGTTVKCAQIANFNNFVKVGDILKWNNAADTITRFNRIGVISADGTTLTLTAEESVTGLCNGTLADGTPTGMKIAANELLQADNPGYRVRFPEPWVASANLLDSSYITRKQFDATSSAAGVLTFTLTGNDLFFEPYTLDNYMLTAHSNATIANNRVALTDQQGSIDGTARVLTISGVTASKTYKLTATVRRTKLINKEKSITRCRQLVVDKSKYAGAGIGSTTFGDGLTYNETYGLRVQDSRISLQYPEIYRVMGVFESNDTTDPQLPTLTISNASSALDGNNVVIGEQFIGNTSGSLARVVRIVSATQIEFVYENQKVFEIGETITLKTSEIVGDISSIIVGDRNIGKNYLLENGQRKEYVDLGSLIRTKEADEPTRKLKIVFDHYVNVEEPGSIENVSSYDGMDYGREVPFVIDSRASDFIDLRPRVKPYSGSGSPFTFDSRDFTDSSTETLVSDKTIVADYDHYLARIDKLYLTKNGTFELKQGEAALKPKPPLPNDEGMEVAVLALKPYMLNASSSVVTEYIPHKRYTMKHIGSLENRIKNLENYTTLSLLETDTKNLAIKDPNTGLDKFKSGFYVDNFRNHASHNFNGESKFDIDLTLGECRPRSTERNVSLVFETASSNTSPLSTDFAFTGDFDDGNIARGGPGLTLAYTHEIFIQQSLATRVENLNPFMVKSFSGRLELAPSTDYWIDEMLADTPEVISMGDEVFNAIAAVMGVDDRENGGMAAAMFNTSETVWGGTSTSSSTSVSNSSSSSSSSEQLSRSSTSVDVGGWSSPGLTGDVQRDTTGSATRTSTTTVNRATTTVTTTTTQSGSEIDYGLQLSSRVDTTELGNKVTGIEALFNNRSRNIEVKGTRMKPNSRYYVFMENVDVTEWCVPKLIPITMVRGSFDTGDIVTSITPNIGSEVAAKTITFRAAQSNHKTGAWNSPGLQYTTEPYNQSTLTSSYSATSDTINVDTFDLADFRNVERLGCVSEGMRLANADGTAEATVNAVSLMSDEFGVLIFSLHIPDPTIATNPKFTTGMSTIRVTSSETNEIILDPGECAAEAEYLTSGQQVNSVQQTLSVRNPIVNKVERGRRALSRVVGSTSSSSTAVTGTSTAVSTSGWTDTTDVSIINIEELPRPPIPPVPPAPPRPLPPPPEPPAPEPEENWDDPLAQSFQVTSTQYADGIFCTGGELYFKSKDDTDVGVEIRELDETGRPSPVILPFAQTLISSSSAGVSTNGTVGTGFTFQTPIYLRPDGEYALVIKADSIGWNTFITRMNEPDVISGRLNDKQPTLGSLFKSQNNTLWTASQQEDLKFTLYKANFVSDTNASIILTNNDLPLGQIRKQNSVVAYSKRQTIGIAATTRVFEAGTTLTQGTNSGNVFSVGGPIATTGTAVTFSHRNTGAGVTGSGSGTEYTNVSFTSLTGSGSGAKATVRVVSNLVDRITITDGGKGYAQGDLIVSGQVGITGSGVRAIVNTTNGTDTIVLDDVNNNIVTGTAVTHYNGAGAATNLPAPTSVTNDPIRDGLTMLFDHKNHGMHSDANKVKVEDFVSDSAPVILSENIISDTTTIKVDNVTALTEFEGVRIAPGAATGYIKIGNEIISYTGVSTSTKELTDITRSIDDSLQTNHDANDFVYKYEFNNMSLRKINATHAIDNRTRTFDSYYVKLTSTNMFKSTKFGSGPNLKISQNIPFEGITPKIANMLPTGTNLTARLKTTSGTSISGSEVSFSDKGYEDIALNTYNELTDPRIVASKTNEFDLMNNSKSLQLQLTLSSTSPHVSPLVDLETPNVILHSNLVDSNVSDYTTDSRPKTAGLDPNSGIYETKRIDLEFDSNSIQVMFDGHREPSGDFKVFYKLYRNDSEDSEQVYTPFNLDGSPDKVVKSNKNKNGFSEYKYTCDNVPTFNGFMIKVVMISTNQAQVPRMKNFRSVALKSYVIDKVI